MYLKRLQRYIQICYPIPYSKNVHYFKVFMQKRERRWRQDKDKGYEEGVNIKVRRKLFFTESEKG